MEKKKKSRKGMLIQLAPVRGSTLTETAHPGQAPE